MSPGLSQGNPCLGVLRAPAAPWSDVRLPSPVAWPARRGWVGDKQCGEQVLAGDARLLQALLRRLPIRGWVPASSRGTFPLVVVPALVLQSLCDSVLEEDKKKTNQNNKTKLESVIVWLQFSISQVSKTVPASGAGKLMSCLAKLSSGLLKQIQGAAGIYQFRGFCILFSMAATSF